VIQRGDRKASGNDAHRYQFGPVDRISSIRPLLHDCEKVDNLKPKEDGRVMGRSFLNSNRSQNERQRRIQRLEVHEAPPCS
jgi:hypothetical protein